MTREELIRLDGKVIDRDLLKEIRDSEDVKVIQDNGIDGNRIGKRWYVVVLREGGGINVYCK